MKTRRNKIEKKLVSKGAFTCKLDDFHSGTKFHPVMKMLLFTCSIHPRMFPPRDEKLFCLLKHSNVYSVFLFFDDTEVQAAIMSKGKKTCITLISVPLTANRILMQIQAFKLMQTMYLINQALT